MLRLNRRASLLLVASSSIALASLGALAWGCNSQPQVEAGISIERVFPRLRFERPVFLTGANDGTDRLFVVEQAGVIRVFENGEDPRSSEVFLDISANTSRRGNEEGLLGLAFHPDFEENGSFFVHYSSSNPDKVGRVSRFRVSKDDPNHCDPSTEEVLLSQAQPWRNHNGGSLAFGPDGYLYVSFGDGGAANDPRGSGQDLSTWLGAILRVDVDAPAKGKRYGVPADNPFVEEPEDAAPEIWAFGLRNVWRFSFDRSTGDLWAGDVGQNSVEEIDLIRRGGNYGWRIFEANELFDRSGSLSRGEHIPPVATYGRSEGISVTGGYVYRGSRYPSMRGSYFFGDYASGNLWRTRRAEGLEYETELVRRTGRSIASFGEDDGGELFILSFDGGVYRIVSDSNAESELADWPPSLSETGLFENGSGEPSAHLIPYEINVPFWSDGATKQRFLHLPPGATLGYKSDGAFEVPAGTTLIKSFAKEGRRSDRNLETRLIRRTEAGWEAATYIWRGEDAELAIYGEQFELRSQEYGVETWHAPSSSECNLCHQAENGYVLGLTAAQLNRDVGGENQLVALAVRGVLELPDVLQTESEPRFVSPWDESAPLETRARTWLDVNCAMCHSPGGTGNALIDLRATTELAETMLIDEPPTQGDLGIEGARLIRPGSPKQSMLLHRIDTLGSGRMPPVGSNRIDEEARALLTDWINALSAR